MRSHIKSIQKLGYSLDDEEFISGMTAVAVPVTDRNNRYVASLAVHAPKFRMSISDARKHVTLLSEAAARIGAGIPESQPV